MYFVVNFLMLFSDAVETSDRIESLIKLISDLQPSSCEKMSLLKTLALFTVDAELGRFILSFFF